MMMTLMARQSQARMLKMPRLQRKEGKTNLNTDVDALTSPAAASNVTLRHVSRVAVTWKC